jgi:toxin ParE1/3/4
MRIRWTTPALRDVEAIGDYIARDDPAAAAKIVTRIFESVATLEAHPAIGRPGRVPGTRELVLSGLPYIVPYRVRAEVVELLAVFHGARRWPDDFG